MMFNTSTLFKFIVPVNICFYNDVTACVSESLSNKRSGAGSETCQKVVRAKFSARQQQQHFVLQPLEIHLSEGSPLCIIPNLINIREQNERDFQCVKPSAALRRLGVAAAAVRPGAKRMLRE